MKLPDKRILAGGAVLLAAGFWFYAKPTFLDKAPPLPPTAEEVEEAAHPTISLGGDQGLVVNVGEGADGRYAKLQISLEFHDPTGSYVGLASDAVALKNEEFAAEFAPTQHRVLDAVIRVFNEKSPAEVMASDHREDLRQELLSAINASLFEHQAEDLQFVTLLVH
ncbi:MAG: flagellar basal body-associated protein FliL [Dehalococcoidia bacterium]